LGTDDGFVSSDCLGEQALEMRHNPAWRLANLTSVIVAFDDCVYGPALVQGRSMRPPLSSEDQGARDLVLAEKWSIKLYRYHRGDVVLLR
jgi:signal peptidase I